MRQIHSPGIYTCQECGEDTERFTKCPRCNLQVCPVCADDGHGDCIAAESAESLTEAVMDIARENSHGDAEIIIADRIRKYVAVSRKQAYADGYADGFRENENDIQRTFRERDERLARLARAGEVKCVR
jgi:hypothetical protein